MWLMPFLDGKRLETVTVKFSKNERAELEKIAEFNDRPLGYVVRELSLRGLAAYLKDKNLRMTINEIEDSKNLLEQVNMVEVEVLNIDQPESNKSQKKKTG